MSDAAEKQTEQPIPALVDVTPQKGRRVRTPDGSLLPEKHILRGEPRSPYWIRAELDGDVKLSAHQPEGTEASVPQVPSPAPEAPEKPGRNKP
nr:DUF2635 domain-containing protein [Methylobacterium sp. ZNC0032]